MADKRKKFTTYLNPEEDEQDAKALEIIESVPLRGRGEFFRAALVGGSALYQLDKRIPFLVTMLFDGRLTADQLVSIIQQTTGWQPSTASIAEVIAAYRNDIGLPEEKPVEDVSTKKPGQARDNFRNLVKKP